MFNSHVFDGRTTADPIEIGIINRNGQNNFDFIFATDADTLAVIRTFANKTFTTDATAGWNISADGSQNASWELNGKTFIIENLRTDLGTIGFDSNGYIHATNGLTIGRMGDNVIKLYDTAVHKLATPILTGADVADFTLILPS